jgi:peptidoglycan/LPS O-acetylase OafA/YrhL
MMKESAPVFSASKVRIMAGGMGLTLVLGAFATGQYSRLSPSGQTLGYLLLSLACGGALLCALRSANSNSLSNRILTTPALRSIGKYSFAMYVLHVPINQLIGAPLRQRFIDSPNESLAISIVYVLTVSALTYAAAVISYYILERPFLQLKRYFVPTA